MAETFLSDASFAAVQALLYSGKGTGLTDIPMDAITGLKDALSGVTVGGIGDAPDDGKFYLRQSKAWVILPAGNFPEAPQDGKLYARKNGVWTPFTPGSGSGGGSGTGGDVQLLATRPNGFMSGAAAVLPDGRIIHLGGHKGDGVSVATSWILDPVTKQFTEGPVLPHPHSGSGQFYCQDPVTKDIYMMGGWGETYSNSPRSVFTKLKGDTLAVSELTGFGGPVAWANVTLAWIPKGPWAGCILIIGGVDQTDGPGSTSVWVYNPVTNSCPYSAPFPTLPSHSAAAVTLTGGKYDGHILLIGGVGAGKRVARFDTDTNTWVDINNLPGNFSAYTSAAALPGGYVLYHHFELGRYLLWDSNSSSWVDLGVTTTRSDSAVCVKDYKVYTLGGTVSGFSQCLGSITCRDYSLLLTGSGSLTPGGNTGAGLPDQAGNAGRFLSTDGANPEWKILPPAGDALPPQTGNAGRFLSTDGDKPIWDAPPTIGIYQGLRLEAIRPSGFNYGASAFLRDGRMIYIGGNPEPTKSWILDLNTRTFTEGPTLPNDHGSGSSFWCQDPVTKDIYLFGNLIGNGTEHKKITKVLGDGSAAVSAGELTYACGQIATAWITKGPQAGKVIIIGGYPGSESRTFYYEPISKAVTPAPAHPFPSQGSGAVTLTGGKYDGHILLIGGYNQAGKCARFDPNTLSWVTHVDLPTTKCFLSSAVALPDGYAVYVSSGVNRFMLWDSSKDSWFEFDTATSTIDSSLCVNGYRVFVSGGDNQTGGGRRSSIHSTDFSGYILGRSIVDEVLPSQTGNANKVLSTDGVKPKWVPMTGGSGGPATLPLTSQDDLVVGGVAGEPTRLGVGGPGTLLGVNPQGHLSYLDTVPMGVGNPNPMTLGKLLDTAWTPDNLGTCVITQEGDKLKLAVTDATNQFHGARIPIPQAPFRLITKLEILTTDRYHDVGVGFTGSSQFVCWALMGNTKGQVDTWTGSNPATFLTAVANNVLYRTAILAFDVDAAGNVDVSVWTGTFWEPLESRTIAGLTHVGVYQKGQGSTQSQGLVHSFYKRTYRDSQPPIEAQQFMGVFSGVSTRGSILQAISFPPVAATGLEVVHSTDNANTTLVSTITFTPKKIGSYVGINGSVMACNEPFNGPDGHMLIAIYKDGVIFSGNDVGIQTNQNLTHCLNCGFTTTDIKPITITINARKDNSKGRIYLNQNNVRMTEYDVTGSVFPMGDSEGVISAHERPWKGIIGRSELVKDNWLTDTILTELPGGKVSIAQGARAGNPDRALWVKQRDKTLPFVATLRMNTAGFTTSPFNGAGLVISKPDGGIWYPFGRLTASAVDMAFFRVHVFSKSTTAIYRTMTPVGKQEPFNCLKTDNQWIRLYYCQEVLRVCFSKDGYTWACVGAFTIADPNWNEVFDGPTIGVGLMISSAGGGAFSVEFSHFEVETDLSKIPVAIQPRYMVGTDAVDLSRNGDTLTGKWGTDTLTGSIKGPLAILNGASGKRYTLMFAEDGSDFTTSIFI